MGRIFRALNNSLLRPLGVEVVSSTERSRILMLLDHAMAMNAALKVPLHPARAARLILLGRLLKPRGLIDQRKRRYGGPNDGGYVMIDDVDRLRVAFSLGVGTNVEWDYALAKRGIDVFQFDHTVPAPPRQHSRFHFSRKRIADVATTDTENLSSLVRQHAAPHAGATILKIDIEGSEWPVFAETPADVLARFTQIVCEFHGLDQVHETPHFQRMMVALRRLREQFDVVHVHGNNNGGRLFLGSQAFPNVLEVTFANRDFYQTSDQSDDYPTALDMPCDSHQPDFYLGRFDVGASAGNDAEWLDVIAMRSEVLAGFDRDAYIGANPDVAAANMDPWTHWCMAGWAEGRALSPDEPVFDSARYLAEHPAVAARGLDPLTHWRGRSPPQA